MKSEKAILANTNKEEEEKLVNSYTVKPRLSGPPD